MRCWNVRASAVLAALALGACAPDAERGSARVARAEVVTAPAPVLIADLKLRFSPEMLEALDRGIALRLELALRAHDATGAAELRRGLRLRYFPLAQQYQLSAEGGAERSFARRAQLLAALDRVRIDLPSEFARPFDDYALTLELDRSALPGPLRLPAAYDARWRLSAPEFRWHRGA